MELTEQEEKMKSETIENEMETETEEAGNSDGGGSRKRPLETGSNEDDGVGCVTKKSNLADVNSEESINVKMMIPAFATGALIGKNGETIANVQKETACRIKMSKNNDVFPNTNERLALVTGAPSAILKVVAFIAEKTKDKFDSSFKSDSFDYKQTERWREIKIVIPSSCAGMVIGKGGEYIKSIKDHTGAFVQISAKDLVDPRLLERVVTIVGRDLDEIVDGARMVIAKLALDTNHSSTLYTNVSYFHIANSTAGSAQAGSAAAAVRPPSPGLGAAGGGFLGAAPFSAPAFSAGPPLAPFQPRSFSPSSAFQNQNNRRYQSPPPPSGNGPAFLGQQALGSSPANSFSSNWLQNVNNPNASAAAAAVAAASMSMSLSSTSSSSSNNNMNNLGNLQVLQFLEGLRLTLRSNGYNETAVAEIMQSMQILAKYNVLGLGLGFGLAAISKMNQPLTNQASLNDDIGHGSMPSGLNPMAFMRKDVYPGQQTASPTSQTALGGGPAGRFSSNIGFAGFDSPMVDVGGGDSYIYRNRSDQRSFGSTGAGAGGYLAGGKSDSQDSSVGYISRSTMRFDQSPRSPAQADYASSVLKEYCTEHNKLELTVPEAIIGAVLGKQGKNLSDIQHYSGAKVEVSKRGQLISGTQDRMISIEGSPESIRIARAKIEKSINEEQQKRSGRNRF